MTPTAIKTMLREFTALYGDRFDTGVPVAALEAAWSKALADIDDETGDAAAAEVMRTLRRGAPVPADVLDAARSMGWTPPAPDRWALIRAAARAGNTARARALLGRYGSQVIMGFADDPKPHWERPEWSAERPYWDGAETRALGILADTMAAAQVAAQGA